MKWALWSPQLLVESICPSACAKFPALAEVITSLGGWLGWGTREVRLSFLIHQPPSAAWSRGSNEKVN